MRITDIVVMLKLVSIFLLLSIANLVSAQDVFKWRNSDLPFDERVDSLVSQMTLSEKMSQLFNNSPAIERLGISKYNWWNECLHGVARAGKATVFPQAIGLAATFDENLMFQIATVISDEARAKHHFYTQQNIRQIYTGLTFWSPNINIFRDPRWGRGQETYGEDPYLTGRMAVNFIKGLQGDDPKYLKTIATAKHYAVHSGPEYTRRVDNIYVNDRDLHETYLPAFRAAVNEANVQSVMCAYNRFRDKPCCGSDLLLSKILRDQFGFKGYVVSDCDAISYFYEKSAHHVVQNSSKAWGWSLATGTDLNCEIAEKFLKGNIDSAVNAGIINEKDIYESLKNLLTARFKLGMFDPKEKVPYSNIPFSVVGSPKHLALTQQAAEKSFVLLKNNGVLPLRKSLKIALIGPNANNYSTLIGNYNGEPIQPITPLQALRTKLGSENVFYAPGTPLVPGIYANYDVVGNENFFHTLNSKLMKGLKADYFVSSTFDGSPAFTQKVNRIDTLWSKSPIDGKIGSNFGVRWSGLLIPQKTGKFIILCRTNTIIGKALVKINGDTINSEAIELEKGKRYEIEVELPVQEFSWSHAIDPSATLLWVEISHDYIAEALDAARQADVIVFCGGISPVLEGEECDVTFEIEGFSHGDRTHINLPKVQEDLLNALKQIGKPMVYVNFSGSAIALNWEAENMDAIVQAFYPGEATGTALSRLLYGEFNPSGRLPITFYKSVKDLPAFKDYSMKGRTYRYFTGEPLFGFGYGLSYTQFEYKNWMYPTTLTAGTELIMSVEIKNKGKKDGEEVVQVYASTAAADVPVPLRTLVAFKRIFLKTGETKTVNISVNAEQLAIIDNQFQRVIQPGKVSFSIGGGQPSSGLLENKACLQTQIEIIGDAVILDE